MLKPDAGSKELASTVLRGLGAGWPLKGSLAWQSAWAHQFMGRPFAARLGLPEPKLHLSLITTAWLLLFRRCTVLPR